MNRSIADIRKDYILQSLNEADVAANPIEQFARWWEDAIKSEIDEVNAMTVATATKEGVPAARIILLKGFDERGFIFFTNYQSAKGNEIADNPQVALLFFWKELERQIRISGTIEKIGAKDSDDYFQSRPAGSRLGAWSSPQSTVIESRQVIEDNYARYEQQFDNGNIPRPPHWGGYLVKPQKIEFWQGRSSRMHDRLLYSLQADGQWKLERLAP
ncbi:MAG: pyridoxamine 5'-phosphate oxidase [Bacteroidota bacterium]|nr:pyridoxamine 5'-phosphate oxidase [Bacteroidota bacterium]